MSGGDPFNLSTMAATPNLSPPQSALAPPQSVLSAGRDQAMQDADSASQMAQQDVNRERQMAQQQRGQIAPLRQQAMQANAQPLPQPPQPKQPPKPPTMEDAQQQTWQQEWLTAAMFLGTLGGALTRRPITNSLAAFTGMIEGVNEGNKQKFDTSMKTWEAENKRVLEANEAANKSYEQILKNRQLDTEQKMAMLQLKAMELKDDAMAQAAITKDQIAVAQLHDQRLRYGQELHQAQTRRDDEQQQRATQWVNSNEGQQRAKAIAEYRLQPPSTLGRTGYQGAINTALMDKVLEINPDYNVNKFKAEGIREAIPARAEGIRANAEARVQGTAGENIKLVMQSASEVIPQAAQAAQAVPATAFPRINELMQTAAKEVGDPALRRFRLANLELAEVLARAMNPRSSVIPVKNMDRAMAEVSTADSPEAYTAMLKQIKGYVERQFAAVEREQAGGGIPDIEIPDAPRALQPTPRQVLPPTGAGGPSVGTGTGLPKPTAADPIPLLRKLGWQVTPMQ